ncbi:MAG: metalloregulator ArsR/SmtB family transcription factor [Caulobacteraceae bacterium]|nr:metalloregulator ArsR/SmtB family transcription factor [Caulobacteraceae bacterium]
MWRPEARIAGRDAAAVFGALGDPTRLGLLAKLSDGQARSIVALSADGRVTRQAITKHLEVLEQAGLVSRARVGRESRYSFRPEPVAQARAYLDQVSAQWDEALERLRALVEE